VRRLAKGAPGLVTYSGEQTLAVRPDKDIAVEDDG
jgi:hypothetical protein